MLTQCTSSRSRFRLSSLPIPVLAVLAVAACGSDVFSPQVGSPYVLMRVNGLPLPVELVATESFVRTLTSDTIRFVGTDRFERVRYVLTHDLETDAVVTDREISMGVVLRENGSVTLVDDVCADPRSLALCIAPDTATIDDRTLLLRGQVPPSGVKEFEIR